MKKLRLPPVLGALPMVLCLALPACGDEGGGMPPGAGVMCGPGTVRSGDYCVPSAPTGMDPPGDPGGDPMMMMHSDAGPMPGGEADGGPGFSTDPPGTPMGEPGCDESMGECTAWAADLAAMMNAGRPMGCMRMLEVEPRIAMVAQRHATHQATVDRLTPESPDGNLFDQITAAGVPLATGASLFASTRTGAADVLMRWAANASTAAHLGRCDQWVGIGFATGASGASYVTVLFASGSP